MSWWLTLSRIYSQLLSTELEFILGEWSHICIHGFEWIFTICHLLLGWLYNLSSRPEYFGEWKIVLLIIILEQATSIQQGLMIHLAFRWINDRSYHNCPLPYMSPFSHQRAFCILLFQDDFQYKLFSSSLSNSMHLRFHLCNEVPWSPSSHWSIFLSRT